MSSTLDAAEFFPPASPTAAYKGRPHSYLRTIDAVYLLLTQAQPLLLISDSVPLARVVITTRLYRPSGAGRRYSFIQISMSVPDRPSTGDDPCLNLLMIAPQALQFVLPFLHMAYSYSI